VVDQEVVVLMVLVLVEVKAEREVDLNYMMWKLAMAVMMRLCYRLKFYR